MKKLFLILFACVLYINAQAQFTFGPMVGAGMNLTSFDPKYVSNTTVKPNGSFLGGAFARVSIKRFYIQPELYYSNKTANISYDITPNYSVEQQLKTGNVNVNALLGVKLLKLTGAFNFRAFAGPSTSLIVAKTLTTAGFNTTTNNIKSSSFNLQAGLGVDITKLTIDVRFEKGFTDLSTTDSEKLKINSLFLVLGFKIL